MDEHAEAGFAPPFHARVVAGAVFASPGFRFRTVRHSAGRSRRFGRIRTAENDGEQNAKCKLRESFFEENEGAIHKLLDEPTRFAAWRPLERLFAVTKKTPGGPLPPGVLPNSATHYCSCMR